MNLRRALLVGLALLGGWMAVPAWGGLCPQTTYYVATTGNDGNSCCAATNATTAKRTINAGLACLSAGETLLVKSGTYPECIRRYVVPSGSAGAPTTVKSEVQYGAVLRPSGGSCLDLGAVVVIFMNVHDIVFDGFTVDMSGISGVVYGVMLTDDEDENCVGHPPNPNMAYRVTIKNNDIGNLQSCGGVGGAGISVAGFCDAASNPGNLIQNNKIHDLCVGEVPGHPGSQGLYLYSNNNMVEGNEIYNINGEGGEQWTQYANSFPLNNTYRNNTFHDNLSRGFLLSSGDGHKFYNNILYRNGTGPAADYDSAALKVGGYGHATTNVHVYNNTFYDNGRCITVAEPGQTVQNNICYLPRTGDYIVEDAGPNTVDHNLFTDPFFLNIAGADFHLTTGSTNAINAGVSPTSYFTTDKDGNTRTASLPYDIGAYEYFSQAPPTPQLLAWWKLDDGSLLSAADATGNGHTATLETGLTWPPGKVGPFAVGCDGLHSASAVGGLPVSGSYSYMVWVKGPTGPATSGPNEILVQNGDGSDSFGFAWGSPAPGYSQAAYHQESSGQYVAARLPTPLQANVWYRIAVTWDQTLLKVYLNGQFQAQASTTSLMPASGNFRFCGTPGGTQTFFPGQLDDIKVWNYALTAAQVGSEYGSNAAHMRHRVVPK
jgi:Concanavalin A-like lectin/glucanases superfamily/Right handed beta helix region